jgi:hypothetical protein
MTIARKRELTQEYDRLVNNAWPKPMPPMTFEEGKEAAKRLILKWRPRYWGKLGRLDIKETSGNRRTRLFLLDRLGYAVIINPSKGWDSLVHTISHGLGGGHGNSHLKVERDMVRYVVKQGWLDGRLKKAPKPKPPKVSLVERRAKSAKNRLKKAEKDMVAVQRRAKKWRSKVKYYDQKLAA